VRNIKDGGKYDLSFCVEMDPVHWGIGLLADAFEEIDVILLIDVVLIS
jgi:hypothetical protein